MIDACLTCDAKCKVAGETCVKDNMFMVAGEITVAGNMDDLNSADSKCEVLFHVNKQSLDFASGVHVDTADFDVDENGQNIMSVVAPRAVAQHRSVGSTQQQHNHHRKQQRQQAGQTEEEEKEEGERRKGERGKEKERDAEEQECKQVKKDATGWTVVTRNKRQRKMVQIFVKVDGGKTSTMEVEMSDRVDDIVKKTPISDQDVYVTSGGRILRRRDKLESCEVRDGSTVEVMSRMRGGGKHKDKKSKVEKKQITNPEKPKQKRDGKSRSDEGPEMITLEEAQRLLEEDEGYQKNIECVSEGSEGEVQQNVQN